MTPDPSTVDETQQRFRRVGELLQQLSSDRDAIRELSDAVDGNEPKRFREALQRAIPNFDPPSVLCDPYIRTVLTLTRRWECTLVPYATIHNQELAKAVAAGVSSSVFLEYLRRFGYVTCKWVSDPKQVDDFVSGVCPGGTF